MKPLSPTSFTLVFAALALSISADEESKRPPKSQVLNRFIGTWEAEKGTETRVWSRGGEFVHFENSANGEFHMLLTHDPKTGNYPGVMIGRAFRALVSGTWDAEDSTMTFEATFPDGNRFNAIHKFTDEDHVASTSRMISPDGKSFKVRTWEQTRRKP
jgi:hypothetical protein